MRYKNTASRQRYSGAIDRRSEFQTMIGAKYN